MVKSTSYKMRIVSYKDVITAKDDQVVSLIRRLEERDRQVAEFQAEIQTINDQLAANERKFITIQRLQTAALQRQEVEMSRLREALRQLQQSQQQGVQQGPLKLPLQLTWRRGPDMPFGMSDYVQSVVVQGKVYVGGGYAGTFNREHIVMNYDPGSEEWSSLPNYIIRCFIMAVLHNQLVLVGGKGRDDKASKVVGVWEPDHKKWIYPYPEMSTARIDCSAIGYNEWLVAAGGLGPDDDQNLSSVEVLNTTTRAWQAGPPLPVPLSAMKTAIVGDTFYLMGGFDKGYYYTEKVYSASFQHINTRREPGIWKEIPGLHLKCSAPLSINGFLLAVGGQDKNVTTAAIHLYQPGTGNWVKVGDLPSPKQDCTCVANTHGDIFVIGGNNYSKRLDIASCFIR